MRRLPTGVHETLRWSALALAVAILALSVRSVLRGANPAGQRRNTLGHSTVPARIAGLTALAVELSALAGGPGNAPLTRGIGKLQAARTALHDELPDRHVHTLLNDAEDELDATARLVGINGYRPDVYLRSRIAA
ncbi:hypothetical protein [Micromonospora sp. LOL_023]|uniref:hypothetical protein n=1 Tax=Micromonospora sp. LOL_023 TaxID=3345418 RepID=UPI003A87EEA5